MEAGILKPLLWFGLFSIGGSPSKASSFPRATCTERQTSSTALSPSTSRWRPRQRSGTEDAGCSPAPSSVRLRIPTGCGSSTVPVTARCVLHPGQRIRSRTSPTVRSRRHSPASARTDKLKLRPQPQGSWSYRPTWAERSEVAGGTSITPTRTIEKHNPCCRCMATAVEPHIRAAAILAGMGAG